MSQSDDPTVDLPEALTASMSSGEWESFGQIDKAHLAALLGVPAHVEVRYPLIFHSAKSISEWHLSWQRSDSDRFRGQTAPISLEHSVRIADVDYGDLPIVLDYRDVPPSVKIFVDDYGWQGVADTVEQFLELLRGAAAPSWIPPDRPAPLAAIAEFDEVEVSIAGRLLPDALGAAVASGRWRTYGHIDQSRLARILGHKPSRLRDGACFYSLTEMRRANDWWRSDGAAWYMAAETEFPLRADESIVLADVEDGEIFLALDCRDRPPSVRILTDDQGWQLVANSIEEVLERLEEVKMGGLRQG